MEEENDNVVMWYGPTKKVHNKVHAQSLRLLLFVFCTLVKVHTPALQEVEFADADAVLLRRKQHIKLSQFSLDSGGVWRVAQH